MRLLTLTLAILSLSSPIFAQNSGYNYDWKSGNSHSWNTDSLGKTSLRGNNYQTGTQWRTTIEKNGSMRGTDSRGNSWRYNADTGGYSNYGTGKVCMGRGSLRTCN